MSLSILEMIPKEEIGLLNNDWSFLGRDTLPGRKPIFPDFESAEEVSLPHRIPYPNSNIWYSKELDVEEGYLWINGDDGVQLFVNGDQVFHDSEMFYPIEQLDKNEDQIQIRIINNAASGGLRQVYWISEKSWNEQQSRKQEALSSALMKAKEQLWKGEETPSNWNDYPIWYNDPVTLPIGKESVMIRWTGEKNNKAKLHYGHDPNMIVYSKEVEEKNGIYTVFVPNKKCQYFYFEMGKTISSLFQVRLSQDAKKISFSVWADSQGGWETFSKVLVQMKHKEPQFTIGIGDLVGNGENTWQYVKLMQHLHKLYVPHYLFPGNHDYDGSYNDWIPSNFNQYLKFFDQKNYQFWREGPCAFLALDPNENFPVGIEKGTSQCEWFEKSIQSDVWKNSPWKIILVHQPPFSQGWKGYSGEKTILDLLKPYWESGLIDLVISGHTHDYERLILNHPSGKTAFLIVGGAGGNLEPKGVLEPFPKMDTVIRTHHFGWITADQQKLEFEALDLEGKVIDQFVLNKRM